MISARSGRTYGTADNMGDLHGVVINNIREVVRREPISLPDDKVFLWLCLSVPLVDEIPNRSRGRIAPKSHGVRVAPCAALFGFFSRYTGACPRISCWKPLLVGVSLMCLQFLGRAETPVGFVLPDQPVYVSIIEPQPLGLCLLVSTLQIYSGRHM